MYRTISLKLGNDEALKETILVGSSIIAFIVKVGLANKTFNKLKLHYLTYRNIRNEYPQVPSKIVQTCRDIASEILKRTKLNKNVQVKKYTALRYDKDCLRVCLESCFVSISTIQGRKKYKFNDNPQIQKYKDWKVVGGTLIYRKDKKSVYLNVVVEKEDPPVSIVEPNVLGIDRGINNILVCSNNQFFNSKQLKKIKGKYKHLRAELQRKGTRSARRKLKKISGRERRFVSAVNHSLSKLIANSKYNIFVLEDLKKIDNSNKGKWFNEKLGGWSFKQFENYLIYKAQELGKMVIKVNSAYTSQTCSRCGYIEKANRKSNIFKCKSCGFELHADLNASRNIAQLGISQLSRLSVNQPNVASIEFNDMDSYKPTNSLAGN